MLAVCSLVQPLAQDKAITSTGSGPDHFSCLWFLQVSPDLGTGTQTGSVSHAALPAPSRGGMSPFHLPALLLLKQARMWLPRPAVCVQTGMPMGLFLRRKTQIHVLLETAESWPPATGSSTVEQTLWLAVDGAGSMHKAES